MDDAFIDGINRHVKKQDVLYHLGDFCWTKQDIHLYRNMINCKQVHLIRGNHDKGNCDSAFSTVQHMTVLKNPQVHLCHYPMISWCGSNHGSIHLYGHCHGTIEKKMDDQFPRRRSMDIGVDNVYYLYKEWKPISFDEIKEYLGL